MSKVQILRGFTNHLLSSAAEKISEQFERTIAEYEEQLWLLKEENERQKKLLDAVYSPQLRLHKTDIQQLLKIKDLHPEKQKSSLNPDQEDTPEPPQNKERQEKKEKLQGPKEDSIEDLLKVIVMKSEAQDEDEVKLLSSQLHQKQPEQMETGPPKNPGTSSHQEAEVQTVHCSELKTEIMFQGSSCLEKDTRAHMRVESFFCSMCDEIFKDEMDLRAHMVHHGAEKVYSCSSCYQTFTWFKELEEHECLCGAAEASWRQSSENNQEETPEHHSGTPGSHQVFTDLESFLSCTAELCVFCRTEQVANEKHLRNKHLREAMYFLDDTTEKFAVACFCKDASDCKRSHYHCPFCDFRTLGREFNFKQHMQKIHGIAAGKIKGVKVYDVRRTKADPEEKLCGSPEEQEPLDADLESQLYIDRPGSHRVFTDLDSFLSCTADECVFCRTEQLANEKHLRNKHHREAVYFLDDTTEKFVVACFCKDTPESKRSHYHCPFCDFRTLVREFNFKQHMQKIHGIAARKFKDREWAQRPFLFTPPDEDKPHSSQIYQRQTEDVEIVADGEDLGGPDPEAEVISEDSSEPETDDSDDWRDPTEQHSGSNSKARKKSHRCPECRKIFETKRHLARHTRIHQGEKPFSCYECGKGFLWKGNLRQHMEIHKEGNPSAEQFVIKDEMLVAEQTYEISPKRETEWLPLDTHRGARVSEGVQVTVKMFQVQTLRGFINQRLSAAAEEIFELFERTIAEYEEQLCRAKEENQRQKKLLDAGFNPQLRPQSPACPADVQQMSKSKEELLPEQQESLAQKDPPGPPHVKEEQEELWCSQERKQLQGLEEADGGKFPFTVIPVKSEGDDEEEEPRSSEPHHRQTDAMEIGPDGEDCGESDPVTHGHAEIEVKTEDFSGPETDNSEDWRDRNEHQSSFKSGVLIKDQRTKIDKKLHCCPWCGKTFERKHVLTQHIRIHTGEKPYNCSVCGQSFIQRGHLSHHMRIHTGEKPYSCSDCGRSFNQKGHLSHHTRIHRGEKPFCCSVCGRGFTQKVDLSRHITIHTGEKPFSCTMCEKSFNKKADLMQHIRTHTGEKPFSCPKCGKRFRQKGHFSRHMKIHTAEKPFSCSECEKSFMSKMDLKSHMVQHGGEKPYSCSVCDTRFNWYKQLKRHVCVGAQTSASLQPISDEDSEEASEHQLGLNSENLSGETI
ncbi:uncharacterized protein LOC141803288 [Halichoeres trimaculatus]|uniref:uncharacterized protein LOC141803288 n=1 Tax=Halichoeres trimaculatus TaxID=147232 RepID=UPI003D9DE49E